MGHRNKGTGNTYKTEKILILANKIDKRKTKEYYSYLP